MRSRLGGILLLAALFAASAPCASAQGCAMCYTAAAGQDAKAQKALDTAIFTLVSPIFLLAGGVVIVAYKRRNAPDDSGEEFPLEPDSSLSAELSEPRLLRLPLASERS